MTGRATSLLLNKTRGDEMAVRPTLKCGKCKQDAPRGEITKVGSINYCPTCLEEKNKPKEMTDWDYLFQYIRDELLGKEKMTPLLFKRLKDFREDYGYTDIGMYYTLKYIHETLGKEVYDDGLLSQIPYYYQQAKDHITRTVELANMADDFELEDKTVKVVVGNRQVWNPKKPLDLGSIDWSEEDED